MWSLLLEFDRVNMNKVFVGDVMVETSYLRKSME